MKFRNIFSPMRARLANTPPPTFTAVARDADGCRQLLVGVDGRRLPRSSISRDAFTRNWQLPRAGRKPRFHQIHFHTIASAANFSADEQEQEQAKLAGATRTRS